MRPAEFIQRKQQGGVHTHKEMVAFFDLLNNGTVSDQSLEEWLTAVIANGLTDAERDSLAGCMTSSGQFIKWPTQSLPGPVVGITSTGGLGDKAILVVAPLLAAAGCCVPQFSELSRGSVGKLQSIPGFRGDLSVLAMEEQLATVGMAIAVRPDDVAPAERTIMSALRRLGLERTVPAIPLIAGSIFSQKLAGGGGLVLLLLDVKCGIGALIPTESEARALISALKSISKSLPWKIAALISNINQPLGYTMGSAIEVAEAIQILRGSHYPSDLYNLALDQASMVLVRLGMKSNPDTARVHLCSLLDSGAAARKFQQFVQAQGGDPRVLDTPSVVLPGSSVLVKQSPRSGWIEAINPISVALALNQVGIGRKEKEPLYHGVGVELHVKVGQRVEMGEPLFTLHHRDGMQALHIADHLQHAAFEFSDEPVTSPPLILARF